MVVINNNNYAIILEIHSIFQANLINPFRQKVQKRHIRQLLMTTNQRLACEWVTYHLQDLENLREADRDIPPNDLDQKVKQSQKRYHMLVIFRIEDVSNTLYNMIVFYM